MIELLAALVLAAIAFCRHALPRLRDRYKPTPVPGGWTPQTLADIRPRWNEPLTHEVIDLVTDELGVWAPALATPVRPVFFDQLRDLRPVDLHWQPSWAVA